MNRISSVPLPPSGPNLSAAPGSGIITLPQGDPLPPQIPPLWAGNKKTADDAGPLVIADPSTAAFCDALLAVTNAWLGEAGQESKPVLVSAAPLPEKLGQHQEHAAPARSEPAPGVQQLLEMLLRAGQSSSVIDTVLPPTAVLQPEQREEQRGARLSTPQISGKVVGEDPSQLLLSARAPLPAAAQLPVGPQQQPPTLPPQALKVQQHAALPPLVLMTEMAGSAANNTELNTVLDSHDHRANPLNPSRSLKLEGGQERWSQQLQSALGERLQMQFKDQVQHATIRLDPPALGKIDISLQIENGRIQVHINASQGEVYRALNQVSNELRQSLTEQNFIQVNVQVSSQAGQQHGQQQREQQDAGDPEIMLASEEITHGSQSKSLREDGSILLTV